MTRPSPAPAVLVRAASMDEAMSIGGQVFHRHTLAPLDRADPPRLTLSSYQAGPVTLGTIQYSAGARVVTGSVRDAYQINVPLQGAIRTGRQGARVVATPQLAAVYGLHQHEFEGFESPTRVLGVKFDRLALELRLEQLLGRGLSGQHIEFDLGFSLTGHASQEWYTILHLLARRLWSEGGIVREPAVLSGLQDAVMNGLLLVADHSHRGELSDPIEAASSRAVREAVAFVESSPEAALATVPELARRVGVGVRALQAGFRSTLGTTPLTYLQEQRLKSARRDLEASDPIAVTVAEIADRWGFAHHGRFAAEYRRHFGEQPSATLRR